MIKNGKTYFKDFVVFIQQDSQCMFDHFSSLCMKGLTCSEDSTQTQAAERVFAKRLTQILW